MSIVIRKLNPDDYEKWYPLFEGYCQFYHQSCDQNKGQKIWEWLMNSEHPMEGLVAEGSDGQLLGLAHYSPWYATVYGTEAMYLNDLFVSSAARGQKVGKKLYTELFKVAEAKGWIGVSLLTQEGNKVGRKLYDQFGDCTDFRFYVSLLNK